MLLLGVALLLGGVGVLVGFQEELGIRWLRPVRRVCARLAARWGPVLALVGSRLLASALTAPFQRTGTRSRFLWWSPFRRPFSRWLLTRRPPIRQPVRSGPVRQPPVRRGPVRRDPRPQPPVRREPTRRWPVRWSPLRRRPAPVTGDQATVRAVGRAPVPGRTVPRAAQRLASRSISPTTRSSSIHRTTRGRPTRRGEIPPAGPRA